MTREPGAYLLPRTGYPFLDHEGPLPIAHRGGLDAAPENTMAAFESAISTGFRHVETDVHGTADGVAIIHHDPTLDRMTDRPGRIEEMTWDEARQARLENGETPARLADLLDAWPDVFVNIDPKGDGAIAPLIGTLKDMRAIDRVCVGSFSDKRLAHLRTELGPGLCTSLGPIDVARLRFASWGLGSGRAGGACVQVPMTWNGIPIVDRRFVTACHDRGLPVHVWTVNAVHTMEHLIDLGVDGLMTDHPRRLRSILEGRGLWQGVAPEAQSPPSPPAM